MMASETDADPSDIPMDTTVRIHDTDDIESTPNETNHEQPEALSQPGPPQTIEAPHIKQPTDNPDNEPKIATIDTAATTNPKMISNQSETDSKNGIIDIKMPNPSGINQQTSSSKSKSKVGKSKAGKRISISNRIKQQFSNNKKDSNPFEIDVGTDTDDDDDYIGRVQTIELENVVTRYDDNAFKDLPYEEEVMERLSIALTYLLHDESPLWTNDDRDDDEYADDLMSMLVAPKHRKHTDEVEDEPEYKPPPSFQQKCTEYTANGNIISQLNSAKRKLNKLYHSSYRAKWKSLHSFWVKWTQFAEDKEKELEQKTEHEEEQEEFDDLVLAEEEALEDDCDDFLQKFEEAMTDIMNDTTTGRTSEIRRESLAQDTAFGKFVKKHTDRTLRDFKMEDPTLKYKTKSGKGGISSSYGETPGSKGSKRLATPHNYPKTGATPSSYSTPNRSPPAFEGVLKETVNAVKTLNNTPFSKEEELSGVRTRDQMKQWITKYKDRGFKWGWHHTPTENEMDPMDTISKNDKSCGAMCNRWMDAIKAIFYRDEFQKEVPLHLPMYAWTWQHLVSFIESEEQYKRFSSIFWEYSINGQEICNMKAKQIELLIECSVLNNSKVFESEFDEFKLLQSRNAFYGVDPEQKEAKNEWEITTAANELYEYIIKGRVQSQIVSRYYTAWDILMQVANNTKHPLNMKARSIRDLVSLLRAEPADGPKQFWKVDAVFFNKIDNYLMALIGRGSVRSIFQKYWPDFLFEDQIETSTTATPTSGKESTPGKDSTLSVNNMFKGGPLSPAVIARESLVTNKRTSMFGKGLAIRSSAFLQHTTPTPHSIKSPGHASKASLPSYSQASLPSTGSAYANAAMQPKLPNMPSAKSISDSPLPSQDLSMSHAPSMMSIKEYKYDVLDKCADCLCTPFCKQWVHNLQRIYLAILLVVIIGLVLGCGFATLWYFYGATEQTTMAMKLAVQSIGDRTSNQLGFQFWVPQLFTGLLLAGIQTNTLPVNAGENTEGAYDPFLTSLLDIQHTSHMFSVHMYNVDNNTMLGAVQMTSNDTIIKSRINNCEKTYVFDTDNEIRLDKDKVACDGEYIATQRPWFTQSQQMEFGASEWTEPYLFNSLKVYGMTLITRFRFESTEIVLLVEITLDTLDTVISINHLPFETDLFVITPQHSVISATNGELILKDESSGELILKDHASLEECASAGNFTCKTLMCFSEDTQQDTVDMDEHIYINEDELSMYAFPFYMVYIDHFGNNTALQTGSEVGFVVISYTPSYLDNIYWAFSMSWVILCSMIVVSCTIVCCNVKTDQERQKRTGFRAASIQTVRTNESVLTMNLFPASSLQTRARGQSIPRRTRTEDLHERQDVIKEEEEPEDGDDSDFSISEEKTARSDDAPQTDDAMEFTISLADKKNSKTDVSEATKEIKPTESVDNVLNIPMDDEESIVAKYKRVDSAASLKLKDFCTESPLPDPKSSSNKLKKKQVSFNDVLTVSNTKLPQPNWTANSSNSSAPIPNSVSNSQGESSITGSLVRQGSFVVNKYTNKYCNCSPKMIIVVCVMAIMITFCLVIGVWVYATSQTSTTLIDELMVKQEWFAVSDEVFKIFDSSDMIYDILSRALREGTVVIDGDTRKADIVFSKLMTVFTEPSGKYRQHYIYAATSNGEFHGSRWIYDASLSTLAVGIQHGGLYQLFEMDLNHEPPTRDAEEYEEERLYDPRCQQWYINAIKHGFVGSIDDAFVMQSFEDFYNNEQKPALQSPSCQSARQQYLDLFNLSAYTFENGEYINLSSIESRSFVLNAANEDLYTITWDRYVFTALQQQGLTASAVVVNDTSGALVGVIGVDYTLSDLSDVLSLSVGNESEWYAWIFEATTNSTIASSDGSVLVSADSIDGCLQLSGDENEEIPVSATQHNNSMIRIMSKEIVEVYGIDAVVNMSHSEHSHNEHLHMHFDMPIDLPKLEVGRLQYDRSHQNDSIDWIVVKTINTGDIESGESNDMTITFLGLAMLSAVIMITFREFKQNDKKEEEEEYDEEEYDEEEREELKYDSADRLGYFKKMNKMKHIVEGSANVLWKLTCDDFVGIITTQQAKSFMAQRANQHVSANENNSFMFLMCALEYRNRWNRLKFFEIMDSNWYSICMQFIILLHTTMTIFEPSTPQQLRDEGTAKSLAIVCAVCITFEFVDFALIGATRYMEFTINPAILKQLYQLNFGIEHKYCAHFKSGRKTNTWHLVFFGPKSTRFLCHLFVFFLILLNFVLQLFAREAPFAYYFPILPLLIIIKNAHVISFLSEFFFAINFARDVLFSYLCFILIFAVFGISLFGETVNYAQTADSFRSIRQAFITSFVYISTSENYDDIVYATIASDYYTKEHWIILATVVLICILFVVLGLFIFIPMIIHKFEEGFSEMKILTESSLQNEKMNAIIAAFIMLDMNGDMGIDMDEFQHLVTHSILINKNRMMADAFNYFDDDGSEELDLYEFTNHLLTQQFRDKLFVTKPQIQNKLQAWLECNVFRRYRFHIGVLLVGVMPAFTISLMQNLKGIDSTIFNSILAASFAFNWLEIHLRWFAFGYRRFFDLKRYPNPPYVVAAIAKYDKKEEGDDPVIIRLSSSQRKWAVHHLRDTRPLSILDKSTLSIIHRCEFFVVWFTASFCAASAVAFNGTRFTAMTGYQRFFLQLGILTRIFTLLRSNQKIMYMVFTVFSAFASLFAFLFVLIYMFARVGCTLFGRQTNTVIDDIYPVASSIIASFDTTGDAMLTLLQLMIGEGWHEVMYNNVIRSNVLYSIYFIVYILIVTIIISNVFVGLFLSDVDELKKSQVDDELKKKFNKSKNFKQYALNKLEKLNYQLNKLKNHEMKMKKQMRKIQQLLVTQQINQIQKQQLANINQINQINPHTQFNIIQE
eukprot:837014_1